MDRKRNGLKHIRMGTTGPKPCRKEKDGDHAMDAGVRFGVRSGKIDAFLIIEKLQGSRENSPQQRTREVNKRSRGERNGRKGKEDEKNYVR